ncbi:SGNH/GDSL hydrolase family protein [Siphonobacter sp. SORGH_AS_0500]|uniref:SGNH/GDSL hydrolase family protein n=1 Tax=Siphonobacter sp. SORGH_AS_0500 TaxID=1864824 RepID=UPI0028650222|nr:SGNH/GDSL hydrolase family protein [Siphonobacter sp. SORGH_AS_0500]MDR6197530.1 lysophospholipase L1-like esterase [Siphonobacter sp. SORGH_AS_0500]
MKRFLILCVLFITLLSAAPRKITWLALGDSITYLNDHPNETGNRITKGYLTLIKERYPQVEYINQGHNGWTAVKIAESIESLGLVKADVYTVFLGTNDWWQGKRVGSLTDYEQRTGNGTIYGSFRTIIDKFRSLNKKARIILITPMQRGDFVYINNPSNHAYGSYKPKMDQTLEQVANAIVDIGTSEKFPVVDLYHDSALTVENMVRFKRLKNPQTGQYQDYTYPAYIDIPFDAKNDDYPYPIESIALTYDGLHPSDQGYEIIANRLIEKWKGLK